MASEDDQEVELAGKYQRSVRLTRDMAARLQAVCEHLGVNTGSYLSHAIGMAVSRDEVSLLAKQSKDSSLEVLSRLFETVAQEAEKPDEKPRRQRKTTSK